MSDERRATILRLERARSRLLRAVDDLDEEIANLRASQRLEDALKESVAIAKDRGVRSLRTEARRRRGHLELVPGEAS